MTFNSTDIPAVIALLPDTFGLRAFDGLYRVRTGYVSGKVAKLIVETQMKQTHEWLDFITVTYGELKREITLNADDLNETQMEPIKHKYRCTRGYAGVGRNAIESREGYYVFACDANEAEAYMRCRFPHETLFTAHEFGAWLASA